MPANKIAYMPVDAFIAYATKPQESGCIHGVIPTDAFPAYLAARYGVKRLSHLLWKQLHGEKPTHLVRNCKDPLCINPEHRLRNKIPSIPFKKPTPPRWYLKKEIPKIKVNKRKFWELDKEGLLDWTSGRALPWLHKNGEKFYVEIEE